jgi:hypothetical protein
MNEEIEERTTAEFQGWMPSLSGAGAVWNAWSIPDKPAILDPLSGGKIQEFGAIDESEQVYWEFA